MKRKIIFSLLSLIVFLGSCDLDPVPTSAGTVENFFNNDDEITAGIINIYNSLQGSNPLEGDGGFNNPHLAIQIEYQMGEILSDNARTKSGSPQGFEFETFTVLPQTLAVVTYYRSMYRIIFNANLVLENLQNATDENVNRFEAEARFLRAYAYFNLVRYYGAVPLIDRVLDVINIEEDAAASFTRVDENQIYQLIIEDLQFAVSSDLDNSFRTRASKAAAQTFLAKVYMTRGTNYGEAQSLLEEVINSGDYSLEPDFFDIFYNEDNDETVFSIGFDDTQVGDSQGFSAEFLDAVGRGTGSNYATDELVAVFEESGGSRTQVTYREDPGNLGQFQTAKFLPITDSDVGVTSAPANPRIAGNDWIVTRYADVLLLHVEAILAGGTQTSDPSALASFQAVRDRAIPEMIPDPASTTGGMIPNPDYVLFTTVTKQLLLDERRIELAFENHRFLDLKRFGVAQEVLSIFSVANGHDFQATDLLLPIPGPEIAISQGLLTQNPGY